MIKQRSWKKWCLLLTSGAMLLQASACADNAAIVTSIASVATAGGVFFLVARVLE